MSREKVLDAVRAALGGASGLPVPDRWMFPANREPDKTARFCAEAAKVDAEVLEAEHGEWWTVLRPLVSELRAVFPGQDITAGRSGKPIADAVEAAAHPDEVFGLVKANHGIAESGTVVVDVDGDHLPSLLTELSVVLLDRADLVTGLEDLPPPGDSVRSRILITGPSRTADIEKKLVLGAHGPKRLVIVLT